MLANGRRSILDASEPIPEDTGESEESRLITGIKKLEAADGIECSDELENERLTTRRQTASSKQKPNSSTGDGPALSKDQLSGLVNGKPIGQGEDQVFKSANWLSDSELIFSLSNQVGGLVRALRVFQELDIGIKHVESRPSKRRESEFEIFVDIDCSDKEKMRKLVHHLR